MVETKSLITELPKIIERGSKEAEKILDTLSKKIKSHCKLMNWFYQLNLKVAYSHLQVKLLKVMLRKSGLID